KMYFYVHDLSVTGDNNVTVEGGAAGEKSFTGVKGTISNLHWVDNDEALDFRQDENSFVMNATGYPYGTSLVVRVAEADIAD
ncbi:MAG: alpha-L-fucosidase, partial [Clostridia bacterium]|nr:alpha-L-fucosidase [Clostridia bacterium]